MLNVIMLSVVTQKVTGPKLYLAPSKIAQVCPVGSLKLQALARVSAVQTRVTSSPILTVTSWWFCSTIRTERTPGNGKEILFLMGVCQPNRLYCPQMAEAGTGYSFYWGFVTQIGSYCPLDGSTSLRYLFHWGFVNQIGSIAHRCQKQSQVLILLGFCQPNRVLLPTRWQHQSRVLISLGFCQSNRLHCPQMAEAVPGTHFIGILSTKQALIAHQMAAPVPGTDFIGVLSIKQAPLPTDSRSSPGYSF